MKTTHKTRQILLNSSLWVFAFASFQTSLWAQAESAGQEKLKQQLPKAEDVIPVEASARLMDNMGKTLSLVQLSQEQDGIRVRAEVSGLKPNSKHGFHVHDGTDCQAPTFESAGGHFNPLKSPHGDKHAAARHPGDLGNLQADAKGVARINEVIKGVSLRQGATSWVGHALIVHSGEDDLKSQPSGNAGARLACGVIKQSSRPAAR